MSAIHTSTFISCYSIAEGGSGRPVRHRCKYREYLRDASCPIPRPTRWRWKTNALLLRGGSIGSRLKTFNRLYSKGVLYHSVSYKREGGKQNSSICCYHDGVNLKFRQSTEVYRTKTFSVLKHCSVSGRCVLQQLADADNLGSFIFEVFPSDTVVAVPIEQLQGLCVYVTMQDCSFNYAITLPNHFDLEINTVLTHTCTYSLQSCMYSQSFVISNM